MNGWYAGWMVLTAKSPHARFGTAEGQSCVSARSRTGPVGVYREYEALVVFPFGIPFESMVELLDTGAPGQVGVAAAISH